LKAGITALYFLKYLKEFLNYVPNIVKGKPINQLEEAEKYLFSIALEKNLFVKNGSDYKLNYFFTEQAEFCKACQNIYAGKWGTFCLII